MDTMIEKENGGWMYVASQFFFGEERGVGDTDVNGSSPVYTYLYILV